MGLVPTPASLMKNQLHDCGRKCHVSSLSAGSSSPRQAAWARPHCHARAGLRAVWLWSPPEGGWRLSLLVWECDRLQVYGRHSPGTWHVPILQTHTHTNLFAEV